LQTNAVINDKLQGTVVTYLRCGEIISNQIKPCLLLSLPVKTFLKSVNIWQRYGQNGELCLALSSTFISVVASRTKSARDNLVPSCNFAKYSQIKKKFTGRLSNKPFLLWLLTTLPHLKFVVALYVRHSDCFLCLLFDVRLSHLINITYIHCTYIHTLSCNLSLIACFLALMFHKVIGYDFTEMLPSVFWCLPF